MRRTRLIAAAATAVLVVLATGLQAPDLAHAASRLPSQSTNEQMVSVTVTPRDLTAQSWEFEVVLNTHVQTLDDDLMKSSALVNASGQRHAPLAWRGDGPGGHHRRGVLVFAPLQPRPASIELQIQRAGEAAPRSFKWQFQ